MVGDSPPYFFKYFTMLTVRKFFLAGNSQSNICKLQQLNRESWFFTYILVSSFATQFAWKKHQRKRSYSSLASTPLKQPFQFMCGFSPIQYNEMLHLPSALFLSCEIATSYFLSWWKELAFLIFKNPCIHTDSSITMQSVGISPG